MFPDAEDLVAAVGAVAGAGSEGGDLPVAVTVTHAGGGGGGHAGAGGGDGPETNGVGHVAGNGKIFVAEGPKGGRVALEFAGDRAQLGGADQRLPGENTARKKSEDYQDDRKFNERK